MRGMDEKTQHTWESDGTMLVAYNSNPPNMEMSTDGGQTWMADTDTGFLAEGTFVVEVAREVLRLAKENAELRKIIERDGDIRRVAPVLEAALKDRDRLAAEVERLKEAAADPLHFAESARTLALRRVRRELRPVIEAEQRPLHTAEPLPGHQMERDLWHGQLAVNRATETILRALDRIVPGEG